MQSQNIQILAIQETHLHGIQCFMIGGYSIMLSGSAVDASIRNYTGVGFIVAPEAQKAVSGFRAITDRIAELRIRVRGGNLKILSCYAPHS